MDVKEAISRRRSIRTYDEKTVPAEVVAELLEAARLAPSGCNAQPWRFVTVTRGPTLDKLREAGAFQQGFVSRAPLVLVCCGDPAAYEGKYGGDYQVEEGSVPADPAARREMFRIVADKGMLRAVRDLSIASGFLVLRATELGLGTCYVGLIHEDVLKAVLGIPEHFVIPFVMTAGYFRTDPPPRSRMAMRQILFRGD